MYEQTMRHLAYIASEMRYFASVDLRYLMCFVYTTREVFENVSWVWRRLNVYPSQLNSIYADCFWDETRRFWQETKIISISYILMTDYNDFNSLYDSIVSPPLISGFLVANIIMAQGVAKFFINMSFSSIYVFSNELFPTVIRYCWYSLDIYQ